MRRQIITFAIFAALAIHGPYAGETAAASERAGPRMEIPWPEWWADLPPPGPAIGPALAMPDAASSQAVVRPTPGLLDMLMSWLATNFGLPATGERPRVELVPRTRLAALRYRGVVSDRALHLQARDASTGPLGDLQAVHAVYDDDRRTLYLPEGWEGETPAEISVLVHELVHHLQNVARLKFGCPHERENIAYQAQTRWLELFGKNLSDELGVDPFDILVRTRCFN